MSLLSIAYVEGCPPVLRVTGEVDIASRDELRAALRDALARHPNVVVDLEGVTFIDAAGLRVLLQVAESLNGARPLVLVNASRVAWLLELVGLQDNTAIMIREDGAQRG